MKAEALHGSGTVLLYGPFRDTQFFSDFLVAESLSDKLNDPALLCGESWLFSPRLNRFCMSVQQSLLRPWRNVSASAKDCGDHGLKLIDQVCFKDECGGSMLQRAVKEIIVWIDGSGDESNLWNLLTNDSNDFDPVQNWEINVDYRKRWLHGTQHRKGAA